MIKTRRLKWVDHVARKEKVEFFKILTVKLTGKSPLGMPIRRWEEYIRTDLKEIEELG